MFFTLEDPKNKRLPEQASVCSIPPSFRFDDRFSIEAGKEFDQTAFAGMLLVKRFQDDGKLVFSFFPGQDLASFL